MALFNRGKYLFSYLDNIDYFIEIAPYGFLFTSRKTSETNE